MLTDVMATMNKTSIETLRQSIFGDASVRQLVSIQARAATARMVRRFLTPRRMVLTIVAVLLGALWIGQAVAGVIFRDSADADKLRLWIPVSLTLYAAWNLVKVVFRQPVRPFEWTPAEEEWLLAAPLRRADLIRYRMSSILRAGLFKSTIFTLIMLPDLQFLPCGFIGMLTGLLVIDLLRMLAESMAWGLAPRERVAVRLLVGILIGFVGVFALSNAWVEFAINEDLASVAAVAFLLALLKSVTGLAESIWLAPLLWPFRQVTKLILCGANGWALLRILLSGFGLWGLLHCLIGVDRIAQRRRHRFEREALQHVDRQVGVMPKDAVGSIATGSSWFGLGPLAGRQLVGAARYRSQLLFALAVPLLLSCFPAFAPVGGATMVLNIAGSLAFYSFLLLPTSMPFDFRRDLQRLTVLKSLPVPPYQLVLSQLAAPVLITTAFQLATFAVAMLLKPYDPRLILVSMSMLMPFNLFIFGFENLMMLWYPYRLNQEGVQIFIRSILSFTAKGLIFALVAALVLAWAVIARLLVGASDTLIPLVAAGGTIGIAGLAGFVFHLLTRTFVGFDPSRDLAGLDASE